MSIKRHSTLFVIILGLLLGALTLAGQSLLPGQLSQLANCYSIWLTLSFVGGFYASNKNIASLYGALVPIAALVAYYVITAGILNLGLGSLGIVLFWFGGGVTAGPLLGIVGYAWKSRTRGESLGPIVVPALFLSEGLYQLLILGYMVGYVFLAAGVTSFLFFTRKEYGILKSAALAIVLGLILYVFYSVVLGALGQILSAF